MPVHNREAARQRTRASLSFPLRYPADLPITSRRDEIAAALAAHQVLVVSGETGSGKSTQLPKICLEAGRGSAGVIGHTQPRRIAARAIAERVADELGTGVGQAVGYKVRFTDRVADGTLVKLMTDGVLLAELHGDRELRAYDTLIVDEAHERSLNIDFILGYLKQLLPSRPDLKLLVTSATIDTEKFSKHFWDAPVIEVTGRTYPVEIRYRPSGTGWEAGDEDDEAALAPSVEPQSRADSAPTGDGAAGLDEEVDEVQAVCDAVSELCREGPGDVLVFLAGEREIRDTAEALGRVALVDAEVLPLFGRLSTAEQHRIFEPHTRRRVVLATNVAETSLTVPGTRFVVDPGNARISRYSRRTKVQRLPIEPISQASANQRAGRCGRLGPGVCARLYSAEDFASRPLFTEPEILRTNLASVVLQMAAIGLGEVAEFPFVDPPDRRNIADAITLLDELGALARSGDPAGPQGRQLAPGHAEAGPRPGGPQLTGTGRKMSQLPLDPRHGRMLVEAARLGCLEDALVVVSALSVQDPRERPAEKRDLAASLHARFDDGRSDFVSFLNLWGYLSERQAELTSGQFRRLCRRELVSYQRVREWQDVHGQLALLCEQLGLARGGQRPPGPPPSREQRSAVLHRALLSGVVTQVGAREGDRPDFAGPRGARFAIWPGSVLARKAPRWVMAAELVETSRLWARVDAPVRPKWVETSASHLLKWSYGDPVWDEVRGEAFVLARAALHGLAVVTGRRTSLAQLDKAQARATFISQGLVQGDWEGAPEFVRGNLAELEHLTAQLQRARRGNVFAAEDALAEFYGQRLPAEVVSGPTFDAWWRRQPPAGRAFLQARSEDIHTGATERPDPSDYPDTWATGAGGSLRLAYRWGPSDPDDGVVAEVPLAELDQLGQVGLEWQVPGLRGELVLALVRSLPKQLRRHLVPIPEKAEAFLAKYGPADGPLLPLLAGAMSELAGTQILPGDFDWEKVPGYLRPTFRAVGEKGEVLAEGKDVASVVARLRPLLDRALQTAASSSLPWGSPPRRSTTWDFGEIPEVFEVDYHGYGVQGYPALFDEGDAVSVRIFSGPEAARRAMQGGTRKLVMLNLASRQLAGQLEISVDNQAKLALAALGGLPDSSYGSARQMAEDVLAATVEDALGLERHLPRRPQDFEAILKVIRRQLEPDARKALRAAKATVCEAADVLALAQRLREALGDKVQRSFDDVISELSVLVGGRFVSRSGLGRLEDIERYLSALMRRLEKLPGGVERDISLTIRAQAARRRIDQAIAASLDARAPASTIAQLRDLTWMVEELRVSFFAQSLGTRGPVSEERITRAVERLLG